jgi:hypothetical protein
VNNPKQAMKHILSFGVVSGTLLLAALILPTKVLAVGETVRNVQIVEVSPQSSASATEEYVELYNPNAVSVNVRGWQIQYRSASKLGKDSWTTKAILGCQTAKEAECAQPADAIIGAGETIRLSSYEPLGALPLVSGMSTQAGQLRLTQLSTQSNLVTYVQDMVGYGDAATYEGKSPAVAPQAGRSIVRKQDDQGNYLDTDDNQNDFVLSADENKDVDTGITAAPTDPPSTDTTAMTAPIEYLDVEITEVLPDPASPKLDSADEFIELFNPYDAEVDLDGYVLETGATWSHKYIVHGVVIGPHEYIAFMSLQTHLSLANDGSGVRLLSPDGKVVYEVPAYGKAKTGDSWVRDSGGQWVWTTEPTPGEPNTVVLPVDPAPAAPKTSTSTTKKPAAAKTSATSTKKAAAAKTTGSVKSAATTTPSAQAAAAGDKPAWWIVLLAVGALAGGYAIYEYRGEIGGFARKIWQAMPGKR